MRSQSGDPTIEDQDARASRRVRQLARTSDLAIAIDLDGTLIPFASKPRNVVVDPDTHQLLSALSGAPRTRIAIVSGRPRRDIEAFFAHRTDLWLAAEHGVWTRGDGAWAACELGTVPSDLERLFDAVGREHPGAFVEGKTWSVCLHYREVPRRDREGLIVAATDVAGQWIAKHSEFEILEGDCVIEVRHRGAHKGRAIEWLRAHAPEGARILALGDDVTDEDAFEALGPDDVAIAVGRAERPTRAEARLAGTEHVQSFLRWLARARSERADTEELVAMNAAPRARVEPAHHAKLVVVSNRLPSDDCGDERARNVGGLVAGISSALSTENGIWLGWSGRQHGGEMRLGVDEGATPPRAQFDMRPDWHSLYYNGYANRSLWPTLHGFVERARFRETEWQAYVAVNDVFAEHASRLATPDAVIWAHDYHLLLLARALRARKHQGRIGHFLHVPFPSLEAFEAIPQAREIIEAMLEFDLLGFHTRRYADNFLRAARHIAGAHTGEGVVYRYGPSRDVRVGVFPLGIDAADFRPTEDPQADAEMEEIQAALRGRKLILGVDRLDYSKGILERIDAFATMLERFPEWRGRVSLIQVAVPSREDVPEYARQRRTIESAIGRLNGKFGEAHWVPVRYVYRSYERASLARLYRAASVGLVTPLRDGMNLVAKEYVAAQDPNDPGVLLLSRFAGAAVELDAALLTNPYDRDGLANDLARALSMPLEERSQRHARLEQAVECHRPSTWAASFLRELSSRG
jgi:alpha,alpha-trehalose-phosphate synthase [UDP-forming]/trehalose-phosphatase